VQIHDETLRDGLQSPSVVDPPIETKIELLHRLEALGVDSVCIGLPAAGPRAFADTVRLGQEIARAGLRIRPSCAGRTLARDLKAIVEVSQKTGLAMEAMTFVGSSPIRTLVERWSFEAVLHRTTHTIAYAVREGLPVTYVTEDTTRTPPDVLEPLFRAAADHGASRICLCDTVGHATPRGVDNLVRFARRVVPPAVGLDWHGHNDRGLALANTLMAQQAGADRLHGCVLGLGERVGNAALELLLVALADRGLRALSDPAGLLELCRLVTRTMHPSGGEAELPVEAIRQLQARTEPAPDPSQSEPPSSVRRSHRPAQPRPEVRSVWPDPG
jgi:2-isopropylmalate synthase